MRRSLRGRLAAAPARPPTPVPNWGGRTAGGYVLLKTPTSGFVLAYRPLGFGYHSHTCSVTSSGCQNVNAAPVCGFACGQAVCADAGTNVPSAKWQPAPNEP